MSRIAPEINLNKTEQNQLEKMLKASSTEYRYVQRAKIILCCAAGKQNKQVAQEMQIAQATVAKWRNRFLKERSSGLLDIPRSGKPAKYGQQFRLNLLKLLDSDAPVGCARWDFSTLAKELNSSVHAVWRALNKQGIHLQRSRSWCVSTDPEFSAKAADIIALYLNPPINAVVLSVDEKPGIQIIERKSGYIRTDNSTTLRAYQNTYKGHCTLNLFAALQVDSGHIYAKTSPEKKRQDLRAFLDEVLSEQPKEKAIDIIMDNYCTHKGNQDWLERYQGRVHFHFTPTSASWLNQVEIWFSIFSRKSLRGASYSSKAELITAINNFIKQYNQNPRPFRWRKREVRGCQIADKITNLCN